VLRAIPVAAQTAATRRQRFRRRKAPTPALVQYRAERVVAKRDGGNIDHQSGLQRIGGKRNPPTPLADSKNYRRCLSVSRWVLERLVEQSEGLTSRWREARALAFAQAFPGEGAS
jgi:hypothetical protein